MVIFQLNVIDIQGYFFVVLSTWKIMNHIVLAIKLLLSI